MQIIQKHLLAPFLIQIPLSFSFTNFQFRDVIKIGNWKFQHFIILLMFLLCY